MAGKDARIAGFISAVIPQVAPHHAHKGALELALSASVVIRLKAKASPDRHVSHGSQGMNKSGGATAQAHPATTPAVSLNCFLPNSISTQAVRDAKITLSRTTTIAEACVSTPKMRKIKASKAG